jgi:nucleoside-diphosphate-sugar epimerase
MRVLVTGGAGFIGSNLVRALCARGDEVVVFDNLVTYLSLDAIRDVLDRVEFLHGDMRCPEDLDRLGSRPFDRVYHLAASFANELSVEHPALDVRSNVEGTSNVTLFARKVGCGLFVYTGSSSSYGDAALPAEEDGPMHAHTPYATSKHGGELTVQASGLSHAVLRLFNVYGPGDPPGRYRNAIPNMMRALDRPGGGLRVLGREATRDFTYVDDVVGVMLDAQRAEGQVVNVGTGVETPIASLAAEILRVFELPEDRITFGEPRPWDRVPRRRASVARLERLFGYVPKSRLPEGLRATARWLRAAGHISRDVP